MWVWGRDQTIQYVNVLVWTGIINSPVRSDISYSMQYAWQSRASDSFSKHLLLFEIRYEDWNKYLLHLWYGFMLLTYTYACHLNSKIIFVWHSSKPIRLKDYCALTGTVHQDVRIIISYLVRSPYSKRWRYTSPHPRPITINYATSAWTILIVSGFRFSRFNQMSVRANTQHVFLKIPDLPGSFTSSYTLHSTDISEWK